jgi:hypothetical protein
MSSLVFSLDPADQDLIARSELERSGIDHRHVRYIDRFSYVGAAANDDDITYVQTSFPPEFDREIAQGRVLLEIDLEDENRPAVERLMDVLGPSVRRFVAGR